MNIFTKDKYDKKIWMLAIKIIGIALLISLIGALVIPKSLITITEYPSWWAELANWLKIIWFLALIAFGATVVIKGRKIMKNKDKDENE